MTEYKLLEKSCDSPSVAWPPQVYHSLVREEGERSGVKGTGGEEERLVFANSH